MMKSKRRGVFRLPVSTIEREPDVALEIMGRCIIVRAEMLMICDAVEYHAVSDEFREVQVGEKIPEYTWVTDSVSGRTWCEEL
jgi:hypothetical protein